MREGEFVSMGFRVSVSAAVCLAMVLACSSTGRRRVDAANSDIARFRGELIGAQQQIQLLDSVMASISTSQGPQLEDAFDAFKRETRILGNQANSVRRRAESMNSSGERFFAAWEEEAQAMGSPAIQQAATERRAQLQATYGALSQSMDATGTSYRPYESSLGDILTFLDNDLTPGGVQAISAEIGEARQQGRDVYGKIGEVLERSAEVKRALSPGAS